MILRRGRVVGLIAKYAALRAESGVLQLLGLR